MAFGIFWAVFAGIFITFGVGYLIAKSGTPPRAVSSVSNDSGIDCATLCLLFNIRRAERCVAQADERRAQTRLDSLVTQTLLALTTWTVATVAAIVAMLIPGVGPLISAICAA